MSVQPPPSDLDGEGVCLAASLADETGLTLDEMRALLDQGDFYSRENSLIFGTACELADAGVPVDPIAVARRLHEKDPSSNGKIVTYLNDVIRFIPSATNPRAHAESVKQKSRLRKAIAQFTELRAEAYTDLGAGPAVQQFLEEAESRIGLIAHAEAPKNLVAFNDVMAEVLDGAEAARKRGGALVGVPTGYDLDRITGGLHDGTFRVVAGRPGSGKSAYVLAEAIQLARQGYGAALFSLEMPMIEIGFRAVSMAAKIETSKMRGGRLQSADWKKLTAAVEDLSRLPLWIDDSPALTMPQIRARLRRLVTEIDAGKHPSVTQGRLGGCFVDYLQLVQSPLEGDRYANRENKVSAISRHFKMLTLGLRLPITAVSQLNRETERRGDKRPQLADLRETGAIEQDADTIVFLYRDDYYHKDSKDKGVAELIVAKQRSGATGKALLKFTAEYTRFDNFAPSEYDQFDEHYDGFEPG